MKIHKVLQGTDEWHAVRMDCDGTASEAAAMMGDSLYMKRDELLKQKATGIYEEITLSKQILFDKGHKAEADILPVIEQDVVGEELYNLTGSIEIDGLKLLASFDGLTLDNRVAFEHKLFNQELAGRIGNNDIPSAYYWQLEQQLLVSDAESVIFACSDGTEDDLHRTTYTSKPERRKALIAGWKQFKIDLENYVHEEVKDKPEAKVIEGLPALIVNIEGAVKSSNLELYKTTAMAFIENINTELKTDDDFANAESTVKFCDAAEKELDEVKRRALSQTQSIDELFRTVDTLKEEMKKKRLTLTKLVKSEKENIKMLILKDSTDSYHEHTTAFSRSLGIDFRNYNATSNFAGVMKGKRSIDSMKNAVNTELARVKIESNEMAEVIRVNQLTLEEKAKDYRFLFNDLNSILGYKNDVFSAIVSERVSAHKAEEKRKLEVERERIEEEGQKKAEAKAEAGRQAGAAVQREKEEATKREHAKLEERDVTPRKTYSQTETKDKDREGLNERQKEFLKKLRELCMEYKPEFYYTKNDDGIHISMGEEEVFVGFLDEAWNDLW